MCFTFRSLSVEKCGYILNFFSEIFAVEDVKNVLFLLY